MPLALGKGVEIGRSGFGRNSGCSPIYKVMEMAGKGRKMKPAEASEVEEEVSTCTSSSSSIGKNSESLGSDGENLAGEKEVQSAYKGPMSALESLEEALPIRRGISSFYDGKSKSFTSLLDATASVASAKDMCKQEKENAYTRKRRNLLASKNLRFKSSLSSSPLRSNGGGVFKRPLSSGRSMLALAVAINNSNSISSSSSSSTEELEQEQQNQLLLPPMHPSEKNMAAAAASSPQYCFFPVRSFSLADLQGMAASGSSIGLQHDH